MTPRQHRAAQVRGRSIATPALAALVLAIVGGCGANPWEPAVPRGETWEYDYQGFRASNTTVVAGSGPVGGYAVGFSFRDAREVHPEKGGKDPFEQSTPIDGYHFNAHLETQGARLSPSAIVPIPDEGGRR
jgi:hypothetical protein